jgi:putative nucleotidyltransferase with HDIG domain
MGGSSGLRTIPCSGVTAPQLDTHGATELLAQASEAAALLARAARSERDGHRAVSRNLYEEALRSYTVVLTPAQVCVAIVGIARTYHQDGDLDAALDCLDAAVAVATINGVDAALGTALNVQAVIHMQRGQLDEADRLYLEAQARGQRAGDRRLIAMTAQNRGIIANVRGELSRALGHYNESLAAYRELRLTREACGALINLGMLHTDLEHWEEAERAFVEATELARGDADLVTGLQIDVNVGELAIARADYDRARVVSERALRLAHSMGDVRSEAELRKHLGIVARETGHYEQAERHFSLGDSLAGQRQDVLLLAEFARERAELLARQGRFRETVQFLNRAHQLFSDLRARRDLADVDRRNSRIESSFLDVVRRWSESIESKDSYTQGHCLRVADLSCAIARRVGLDDRRMFWFRVGALLHDVGKINIPPEILNKPGKLTAEEWALMRSHPEAGVELLRGIDFPGDVLPIVLSHHERWNGSGYPRGLAGEDIPMAARVLGLADVYDALTTERSYKPGMPHEVAMQVMRADSGTHFDPELFREFEAVMRARYEEL